MILMVKKHGFRLTLSSIHQSIDEYSGGFSKMVDPPNGCYLPSGELT